MSNDENKPAEGKPPAVRKDGSPADLRKAPQDLKARIEEAKRRNDMPLDAALGNP